MAQRAEYERNAFYKPYAQQTLPELFQSHSNIKKVAVKAIMPLPGETVLEQRKRLSRLGWAMDSLQEINEHTARHVAELEERLMALMTPASGSGGANVVALHPAD